MQRLPGRIFIGWFYYMLKYVKIKISLRKIKVLEKPNVLATLITEAVIIDTSVEENALLRMRILVVLTTKLSQAEIFNFDVIITNWSRKSRPLS